MSDIPPPPPPPGDIPPPPPPPPSGAWQPPLRLHPAGFGQRLVALIIDGFILGIPAMIGFVVLSLLVPTELVLCQDGAAICEEPTDGGAAIILVGLFVAVLVVFWYYGEFDGRRGATLGRRAMKIKLVRAGTDDRVGFWRAIVRQIATAPSGWVCYLGYLWMLWDDERQTWHDKIVDTQVVKA